MSKAVVLDLLPAMGGLAIGFMLVLIMEHVRATRNKRTDSGEMWAGILLMLSMAVFTIEGILRVLQGPKCPWQIAGLLLAFALELASLGYFLVWLARRRKKHAGI